MTDEFHERYRQDPAPKTLAKWIGSDGKTYATDDPDVIRMRRQHGHNDWIVPPPADL